MASVNSWVNFLRIFAAVLILIAMATLSSARPYYGFYEEPEDWNTEGSFDPRLSFIRSLFKRSKVAPLHPCRLGIDAWGTVCCKPDVYGGECACEGSTWADIDFCPIES